MNGIAEAVLLKLLRAYRWAISPALPPACRYVPTCSEYATEAIERYGAWRGLAMAIWRLLRCHPFARGGFDPVALSRGPDTLECHHKRASRVREYAHPGTGH
jgi:putative membrane protein insertion efficiency factor